MGKAQSSGSTAVEPGDLNNRAGWFCQLEISRQHGDRVGERQAIRELELLGVTVSYRDDQQGVRNADPN